MAILNLTTVNHVVVDIAASRDVVWKVIIDEYVHASKFRAAGYSLEPIEDATAVLGGYRMRLEREGAIVEDRTFRITECDEGMRRLSLFADCRLDPDGVTCVYATYQAQSAIGGSRYALDCHAGLSINAPLHGARDFAARAVAKLRAQFDADLMEYLVGIKKRVESGSSLIHAVAPLD
jgi:hypothetical protein